MQHHMLLNKNMWIIWIYLILVFNKIILWSLQKSIWWKIIYNLSSLAHCKNLYLLRSDWSNMALTQVLHPYLILFLLIIGYIYFGMCFISGVSPIHTFPSTVIVPKNLLQKLVIFYQCVSLVLIFEVDAFFFTVVPLIFTNNKYLKLG